MAQERREAFITKKGKKERATGVAPRDTTANKFPLWKFVLRRHSVTLLFSHSSVPKSNWPCFPGKRRRCLGMLQRAGVMEKHRFHQLGSTLKNQNLRSARHTAKLRWNFSDFCLFSVLSTHVRTHVLTSWRHRQNTF